MVTRILADVNIEGQLDVLVGILKTEQWADLWGKMEIQTWSFQQLGLSRTTPDSGVWRMGQQHECVLITANRKQESPDSLEPTIRRENTPASLPVINLADPDRIIREGEYARRTTDRLLDYLFDIDQYRGTGRLYVP